MIWGGGQPIFRSNKRLYILMANQPKNALLMVCHRESQEGVKIEKNVNLRISHIFLSTLRRFRCPQSTYMVYPLWKNNGGRSTSANTTQTTIFHHKNSFTEDLYLYGTLLDMECVRSSKIGQLYVIAGSHSNPPSSKIDLIHRPLNFACFMVVTLFRSTQRLEHQLGGIDFSKRPAMAINKHLSAIWITSRSIVDMDLRRSE